MNYWNAYAKVPHFAGINMSYVSFKNPGNLKIPPKFHIHVYYIFVLRPQICWHLSSFRICFCVWQILFFVTPCISTSSSYINAFNFYDISRSGFLRSCCGLWSLRVWGVVLLVWRCRGISDFVGGIRSFG